MKTERTMKKEQNKYQSAIDVLNERARYWRKSEREFRNKHLGGGAVEFAAIAASLEYAADLLSREED